MDRRAAPLNMVAIYLGLSLPGCTTQQVATISAALTKADADATTALQKVDTLITSGAAQADIQTAINVAVAVDPSSTFLQKAATAIKTGVVANDLAKAHTVAAGAVAVLQAVAPAGTTAPTP